MRKFKKQNTKKVSNPEFLDVVFRFRIKTII